MMEAQSVGLVFGQILMMAMMGGGMGIPLGVPPEKEDALMARVAPEECLFYTTWAGMATPDPNTKNETERLLADKEIRHVVTEIEQKLSVGLKLLASMSRDPQAAKAAEWIPKWGKLLLTHPVAIYVSDVKIDVAEKQVDVKGGALVNVGDQADEFKAKLLELQKEAFGDAVNSVEIENGTYYQIHPAPKAPVIHWGIRGTYLIIGIGENGVQDLYANIRRNTNPDKSSRLPKWLAELRGNAPVERISTVTYANLGKMITLGASMSDDPEAGKVIKALGVDNIASYGAVTGMDKTGFVNQQFVGIRGQPKGLMMLAADKPLTAGDLKAIPHDATLAFALRLDSAKAFDTYMSVVTEADPIAAEEMKTGLDEFERAIGLKIRGELLESLGDVAYVYAAPSDGGLLSGWTAAIQIRDRMTLGKVHQKILELARASFADPDFDPQIKQFKFAGQDVYYIQFPDVEMPILPSWCITEKELVIGLFPNVIKAHLSARPSDKSIIDREQVASLFKDANGPIALTYYDTPQIFQYAYSFVQLFAQMGLNFATDSGLDIDVSILPSTGAFMKHLQPSVMAVQRTERGIEAVSRQTIPSGSVGAAAPVMVALLLPAIQSARTAARRSQDSNNLKQIGLAFHNFHDIYRTLPAAHNVDAEGKPLLSWRVHILPLMEQQELYKQFHLDEPWDSEHNKKLIAKMPATFRSPASKAPPGKTTYLAIGGDIFGKGGGVFRAPADDAPTMGKAGKVAGTTFGQITDGLSNTIFVVSASDQLAVEWTKPVEFKPDDMNPVKGLSGMFPGGFNVLMGDASVHFFPETVDKTLLKRLLDRKEGQPATIPR